jgi:hypothetical protein
MVSEFGVLTKQELDAVMETKELLSAILTLQKRGGWRKQYMITEADGSCFRSDV